MKDAMLTIYFLDWYVRLHRSQTRTDGQARQRTLSIRDQGRTNFRGWHHFRQREETGGVDLQGDRLNSGYSSGDGSLNETYIIRRLEHCQKREAARRVRVQRQYAADRTLLISLESFPTYVCVW